jgi:copper chaperone
MIEQTYKIEGMTCQHCVMAVKMELKEIRVDSFEVKIGSAKVRYDENKISNTDIIKAIEEAGYKVV